MFGKESKVTIHKEYRFYHFTAPDVLATTPHGTTEAGVTYFQYFLLRRPDAFPFS